jgi:hypothetical protein
MDHHLAWDWGAETEFALGFIRGLSRHGLHLGLGCGLLPLDRRVMRGVALLDLVRAQL